MNRQSLALFGVLLSLLVIGCRKDQSHSNLATSGKVTATAAYQTQFGPPPTVQEGNAFAMVGYLPQADHPEKVIPLPLFLYSETNRMLLVVERLLSVEPEATERIGATNPFPKGTLLNTLVQDGDLLTVDLGGALKLSETPQRWVQIYAVLGHSLLQFPGVARVCVTVDGQLPEGYSPQGVVPDSAEVASPGEPKLLGVVGTWDQGASQLREVSIFFDRPLEVKRLILQEHGGPEVSGKQFRSVFDMAVVVLPSQPEHLREGQPMTVSYEVVDGMGRPAKGEMTLPLSRMEHP